ncbi:HD domain-containing protein [Bacillus pinisoli]|uniref:HD domain-containing protein n=1 Tax=Bacillus pinisoli TaxID=2901866 RepID=UPI001FF57BCD|nr:HD domain-containing protein [Bacillus pinisoli]
MDLIEKARNFAQQAHEGQLRRLTDDPYFIHPEGVATILQEAGMSDEIIAAGYLHDTVEDTNATILDIKNEFGSNIASIVAGNTEDKSKTWEERKQHTIDLVRTASFEIKCLVAADKLDNLRSLMTSSETVDDIWSHFKRGEKQQAWYYSELAQALEENLNKEQIPSYFFTYQKLVQTFFRDHT